MTSKETKRKKKIESDDKAGRKCNLILHNDNVHTFDYVTKALIDVCNHSFEQASQCTLITHFKGKCDVKNGGLTDLKPLRDALIERKLIATID